MATVRYYFLRIEKEKGKWVSSKPYKSREELFAKAAPYLEPGKRMVLYYNDIETAQ